MFISLIRLNLILYALTFTLHNSSLNLAEWLSNIPLIYYPGGLQSAAIRFKNSLQENSKLHTKNYRKGEPLHLFSATYSHSTTISLRFLDSGASQYMIPSRFLLGNYYDLPNPPTILLRDNSSHEAIGCGYVLIQLKSGHSLLIQDILYVPGLAGNLISVSQITIGNIVIIF